MCRYLNVFMHINIHLGIYTCTYAMCIEIRIHTYTYNIYAENCIFKYTYVYICIDVYLEMIRHQLCNTGSSSSSSSVRSRECVPVVHIIAACRAVETRLCSCVPVHSAPAAAAGASHAALPAASRTKPRPANTLHPGFLPNAPAPVAPAAPLTSGCEQPGPSSPSASSSWPGGPSLPGEEEIHPRA